MSEQREVALEIVKPDALCRLIDEQRAQIAALTKQVEELTGSIKLPWDMPSVDRSEYEKVAAKETSTRSQEESLFKKYADISFAAIASADALRERAEKAEAELATRNADISDKVSAWHEYLRNALGCSVTDPLRFDFYAQEIIKLRAELAALREGREPALFKTGQKVTVNHPRYHGKGIVGYDTGNRKRMVGVALPNGNTWEYEVETVALDERILDEKGEG